MSKVGFQDFWAVGCRLYIQKENESHSIDMGVIQSVSPSLSPELLELQDSDGGSKALVDETLTKITESYDITVSNMNLENLSLLFLSTSPEAFTQSLSTYSKTVAVTKGRLHKIADANDVALYNMRIAGITSASGSFTAETVTGMVSATKTLQLAAGSDTSASYSVGEKVILNGHGLPTVADAGTYTVVSASYVGGTHVEIVVAESFTSNSTGLSNITLRQGSTGTVYTPSTDWEVVSHDRGFVRIIHDGSIATGNVIIYATLNSLSGARLLYPQKLRNSTKGTAYLFFARGNNSDQAVRECSVSISPSSANLTVDDFSNMVLSVKVLNDLTATNPAGRYLEFKGDLPDPG